MKKLELKNLIKEVIKEYQTVRKSATICENDYDVQRVSTANKPRTAPAELVKLYNTLKSSERLTEGGYYVSLNGDRIKLESENHLFIISYDGKSYNLTSPKHKEKILTDYRGVLQRIKDDIDGE